jgi:iron complex outermembrane receptor protein
MPAFALVGAEMSKKPVRSLTALGLVAATLPLATTVAQEVTDNELELGEVVVTGTRLALGEAQQANPVISYDAERLEKSGYLNLTDFLARAPALGASETLSDTSGFGMGVGRAGLNLLNLRNLGTDRTLVLVNGRRHIAGDVSTAAVDINSLPVDLIERIDVLTGGVSAIYGADGVSGVVNFVTRRDFDGVSLRAQSGLSDLGDGDTTQLSLTAGRNFADGAGNVALAYEFGQTDRVRLIDRARTGDPLKYFELLANPDDPDDDPSLFDLVPLNNVRWWGSSRDGAIDVDGDGEGDFTGSGDIYDSGLPVNRGRTIGGSGTPVAGYSGDLRAKTERHVLNLLGSFKASDRMRGFAEAKFARTKTQNEGQSTFDYFTYIPEDNPFIPDVIRNAIIPGAAEEWFEEPVADGILMTRDNFDLGARGDRVTRDTLRGVLGVDGWTADNVRYELSYTFGQTKVDYFETNSRIEERYFAAIDAVDEGQYLTGTPNGVHRCRVDLQPTGSTINYENLIWGAFYPGGDGSGVPQTFTPGMNSGCLPLNLFGENVADPAAVAWVTTDTPTKSKMTHHVVSGSLSGNTGRLFNLSGGAISWAAGAEYRKEKSVSVPDELIQQEMIFAYPLLIPEKGSFDVREVFGEVRFPLAQSLSVGTALRLADYSTVGSATTWKIDSVWAPLPGVTFRGTLSQAVRAPNIAELYMPVGGTYEQILDPCDKNYRQHGPAPANRQANCLEILTALEIDPESFEPSQNVASIPGSLGGNSSLKQETAKSWTAGVSLRPTFAPGLHVAFDWYRTRLKDAINTVSANELADLCVDAPSLDNVFCESIYRDETLGAETAGYIDGFFLSPQNVSRFTVAGADLTVDYTFIPASGWGRFDLRATAGYLDELTFVPMPGAETLNDRKQPYAPKYMATGDFTWTKGDWSVNFGSSYFSKTRRYDAETLAAEPDYVDPRFVWYKASWVHDLQVGYTMRDKGLRIYGGANNVFDAGPDFPSGSFPNGWMGRYFYAGAKLDLER